LRAGAERFKFFDLAEIENLRACSGLKARIKQRQQRRDVYRNLTFHGHHLTASMIRPRAIPLPRRHDGDQERLQ
jgi:hypothetical protein